MFITDLTVEIRDSTFARIGQLMPADLVGAKFIDRFNNVGAWSVTLPYGHVLADALRTPGAGIIVTLPDGKVINGPMQSARLEQKLDDPEGNWIIEGFTDSVVLADLLAYPLPSTADVTAQTVSHDIRTGPAETVIKQYVDANLVSGPVVRQVAGLTVETDAGRGSVVTGSARFEKLQDLLYPLAQTGGIGYTVDQVGTGLVFKVYEPVDRTSTIRMDLQNGKLSSAEYAYARPKMTRAIVGGAGEAVERLFYEGTNADSLSAETVWGRRIESFVDDRGSDIQEELVHAADGALADDGKTIVNLTVIPSDDINMRYGFDWGLGDKVTVVVGETEASAVVYSVGISVEADGVRVSAEVGTPSPLTIESKLISAAESAQTRISNLERNTTGFGVNTVYQAGGGTNGTQPVFPASALTSSYNRFGNMVHFSIAVDFTNITSFGTGQYYVTLPYATRVRYTFANGHFMDTSAGKSFNFVGECAAGSNQVWIYYIGSNGQMQPFTSTNPAILTTADAFDISGTYEIET